MIFIFLQKTFNYKLQDKGETKYLLFKVIWFKNKIYSENYHLILTC